MPLSAQPPLRPIASACQPHGWGVCHCVTFFPGLRRNHLIIAVKEEMQAWDALGNGREHSGTLRNTPEHSGTSARVRESARECAGRASPAQPEHFFRTTITFYGVTFRGNSINQSCSACPDLQYIKRWALHSLVVVGGGGVKIGVKSTGSRTTPTLRNTP